MNSRIMASLTPFEAETLLAALKKEPLSRSQRVILSNIAKGLEKEIRKFNLSAALQPSEREDEVVAQLSKW